MSEIQPTERTRLRRVADRGVYDADVIHAILDQGFLCHVAFAQDGQPFCLPMVYARRGSVLYLHGSKASRLMRTLRDGAEVAVTVTHVDGLVLGRSAFHHSVNFRSVAVFGRAREVTDVQEKLTALEQVVEHAIAGRYADVRGPNASEFQQTMVLEIPIDEASAKVRNGPPIDEEEDYALDCWAGVIPLETVARTPVADPRLSDGIAAPVYATDYRRPDGSDAARCHALVAQRRAS